MSFFFAFFEDWEGLFLSKVPVRCSYVFIAQLSAVKAIAIVHAASDPLAYPRSLGVLRSGVAISRSFHMPPHPQSNNILRSLDATSGFQLFVPLLLALLHGAASLVDIILIRNLLVAGTLLEVLYGMILLARSYHIVLRLHHSLAHILHLFNPSSSSLCIL